MTPPNADTFRFYHRLRVRWVEVDLQKIVFNAHYLMYFDTAISDYWRALGLPYVSAMAQWGGDLYVKKATLEYSGSAGLDDILTIGLACQRIGTSSITFTGVVFRGDQKLVSAELIYVYANPATQTPQAVPDSLRQLLLDYEAGLDVVTLTSGTWTALERHSARVRQRVFMEEQGVPAELEWDQADLTALHAVAINRLGQAMGTARLTRCPADGGSTMRIGRIGRLAVIRELRGSGLGQRLLSAMEAAAVARGYTHVILQAQMSARDFYRKRGYSARGNTSEEAGIAHIEMIKALAGATIT